MGKAIIVASGKGGVGKTTLTVNLGSALAALGNKVLVADMNFGLRNDDIYMGLEDRILFDLGDVATGVCKLEKAIVTSDANDNLDLISCPQSREIEGMTAAHIKALYTRLKKMYDLVLVDAPVMPGSQISLLSYGIDEAVIVVSHDYTAVRNGDTICRNLAADGIKKRYFAVNQLIQGNFGNEYLPSLDYISKSLDAKCIGLIPFDQSIHLANNSGSPIACSEDSYLSDLFTKMAKEII